MDYAIIRTGGKQYRVSPGDVINVERLPGEEGARLELTDVLLLSRDGNVIVGEPTVPGARVVGEVEKQGRGEKITVFRFKAKTRQGKKTGHRQELTRLRIVDFAGVDGPWPRARRSGASATESSQESKDGA